MGSTAISRTYTDLLSSTAARWIQANFWDNITNEFPVMNWLRGKNGSQSGDSTAPDVRADLPKHRKGAVVVAGGESIRLNVQYALNNTVARIANYTPVSLLPQSNHTLAQFEWRELAASVVISKAELLKNQGSDTRITDLLKARTMDAQKAVEDQLSADLWSDGSVTNQINGLAAVVKASGTLGNISRTSNSWWNADVTSTLGSFATGGLAAMRTSFDNVSFGRKHPDLIVSTQAVREYYENSLDDQIRYTSVATLDGAPQSLLYKGVPFIFDRDCTSGVIYFLNSENVYWVAMKGADATITPFVEATVNGQLAEVALIHVMGNLVANECRKLASITGVTA